MTRLTMKELFAFHPATRPQSLARATTILSLPATCGALAWLAQRAVTGGPETQGIAVIWMVAILVFGVVICAKFCHYFIRNHINDAGDLITRHTRGGLSVCGMLTALASGPGALVLTTIESCLILYESCTGARAALCGWCRETKVCR